jgi:DNA repair exonuclease SbcCD ATPase subunit
MVSFLKGRRRTDDAVVAVDSSGAHITLTLETLVARAEQAIEQLRALSGVLERSEEMNALRERCEAVEQKVAEMEGTQARIAAAESQIQRVAGAGAEIDQLQGRLGEFGDKIDAALKLREQIEGFLSLEGPIGAVRTDAEGLRKQLDEMGEDVTRMRTQADDALRAHRHSTARLEHFNEEYQTVTSRLDEAARRVQVVERALEPVGQAVTAVPDLQHRLAVLKALADQVAQKSAALEQQREAVDRAATQISQLTRLDRELDAWLRRQEEQIRRFGQIEAKITEVHAVQAKVMGRSEELQQMATQTEEAQQAARQSLNDLREQMRKSSESFELENRGLHAVSERVADLRNAVKECESRFAVLDAASQGTAAVTAQVRSVGEQAGELAAELSRLLEEEKRISSLRQEVGRLDGVAAEVTARMGRIEELRPAIESAVKDLGSLKGTRELMADGLEQMRVAYEEISRLRESHGEVESWLTNTDTWTKKVQGQVKELSGMEPAVERIREEVEQVKGAMVEIEARRETLNDVQRRLGDLGAVSAELKERADALRGRMETAESRFTQLAKQAEEAQLVADTMAEVTGSVSEAEKRMSTVDDSVRGLESRTSQLDELQDRIRLLGQELDQRQGALDKATEHLTRASALRQEAAENQDDMDLPTFLRRPISMR